ncbi:pentapeptide repeat-containing protein [Vampirovibrio chlorellavorus]|uniref:pentapeptide repeat-containing protein n=1 Tax=Vampirovibrio chlorellavorus TaxID=758823 RepID=UPI003FCE3A81
MGVSGLAGRATLDGLIFSFLPSFLPRAVFSRTDFSSVDFWRADFSGADCAGGSNSDCSAGESGLTAGGCPPATGVVPMPGEVCSSVLGLTLEGLGGLGVLTFFALTTFTLAAFALASVGFTSVSLASWDFTSWDLIS